ncbi:hypothetical protein GEMRC1_009542 [Eukaryota sp. GEM-RC1]
MVMIPTLSIVFIVGLVLWFVSILSPRFYVPLMPNSTLDLSFLEASESLHILGGQGSAHVCYANPPLIWPSPPVIYTKRETLLMMDKTSGAISVTLNAGSKVYGTIVRSWGSSIVHYVLKGEWKSSYSRDFESWCSKDDDDVCEYIATPNTHGDSDRYHFIIRKGFFWNFNTKEYKFNQMIHDLTDCRKITCDLADCQISLETDSRVILKGTGDEIQQLNVLIDGADLGGSGLAFLWSACHAVWINWINLIVCGPQSDTILKGQVY